MGTDDLHHKRKKNKRRKLRYEQRILIVTEGQTEYIYFLDLKNYHRLSNVDVIKCSTGSAAANIYKEACDIGNKEYEEDVGYTHIFCVFDLDTAKTTNAFGVIEQIYTAKHEFCSEVHAIVSNPCFEVWFLLHFEYSCSAFSVSGNKTVGNVVKSGVNAQWKKAFKSAYIETIKDTYQKLLGRKNDAHTCAKRLADDQQKVGSINPITNVYQLVEFLETLREQSSFPFTRIQKPK